MADLPISIADVEAARVRIAGAVEVTPTRASKTLSDVAGAHVVNKFENLQFTASFKERGALNRLLTLSESERTGGVVCASAGNHAQAVAYHAGRLGVPATVVMPEHTPNVKVTRTAALGANVLLRGSHYDDSATAAEALADQRGLVLVSPFDDPAIMAGTGTVALEMLEAVPELEVLVVPVGGGGLISGIAVAAKARRPQIEVVGVQAAAIPAMVEALGRPVGSTRASTIADGIAVKRPGVLTRAVVEALVDDVVAVEEDSIEQAVGLYLEIEKTVAEGAGAAALAALIEYPDRFQGRTVGLVVSGGNIDLRVLSTVIVRSLARSWRLVHMHAEVDDVPGALGALTTVVGEEGGNIVEIEHRRDIPTRDLRRVGVELAVETRDHAHVDRILERLREEGVTATVDHTATS